MSNWILRLRALITRAFANDDRFNNLTGGIQHLAVAIAVLVGGIWTATVFIGRSELRQSQIQLQISEQEAKQSARMSLELAFENLGTQDRTKSYVKVVAKVKNHGNRGTYLSWKKIPALAVTGVHVNGGALIENRRSYRLAPSKVDHNGQIVELNERRLAVGDEENITFILSLKPGLYLATFTSEGSELDLEDAIQAKGIDTADIAVWQVSDYFLVPEEVQAIKQQ